jgi:hypothetical protein
MVIEAQARKALVKPKTGQADRALSLLEMVFGQEPEVALEINVRDILVAQVENMVEGLAT